MESTSQVAAIDGSLIAVFHDFGLHSVIINGGQPLRIGDGLTTLTRGTMLSPTLCLMPKSQPTSEKIDVGGLAFTREFSCSVPQHGNVSRHTPPHNQNICKKDKLTIKNLDEIHKVLKEV